MKVNLELSEKEAKKYFTPRKNNILKDLIELGKKIPRVVLFFFVLILIIFLLKMSLDFLDSDQQSELRQEELTQERMKLMQLDSEDLWVMMEKRTLIWFGQSINGIGIILGAVLLIHGFKVIGK